MNSARTAAVLWSLGAMVYLVSEAVAAKAVPGYSYLQNYISDLGVATVMNIGFVVHGALFALGAIVITRGRLFGRGFLAMAVANAVGNVMIAVFPSHVPSAGPWHLLGAALAIVGGNLAVILGGRSSGRAGFRLFSVVLGVLGIVCLVAVVAGAQPAGLVERGAVYSIVLWELVTAVVLLTGRSR